MALIFSCRFYISLRAAHDLFLEKIYYTDLKKKPVEFQKFHNVCSNQQFIK